MISPAICQKAGVDPDRFIRQASDRYDGEILHNDHSLELLVGKLKQLGVLENTLIIVLSDHGEEFWDHGWTAHGHTVYQELTHTLLLMWNPQLFPNPRQVSEPVQLIDVMPTVLDLLGLKTPPVVEGQSLAPLARGQAFKRRGLVVSSRFAAVRPEGLVPENAVDDFAIMDARWKFIYRNKAAKAGVKKVELYDRRSRPDRAARCRGRSIRAKWKRWSRRSRNGSTRRIKSEAIIGHTGRLSSTSRRSSSCEASAISGDRLNNAVLENAASAKAFFRDSAVRFSRFLRRPATRSAADCARRGRDGSGFVERHWNALPNLARMRDRGYFSRLGTTTPPQSPVAWSTFITGLEPAEHGIFDFVHRDPATLQPFSSMSRTEEPRWVLPLGPYMLPLSGSHVISLRRGTPFWQKLSEHGIPVTVMRMPTNYPPVKSATRFPAWARPICAARSAPSAFTPTILRSFRAPLQAAASSKSA